MKLYNFLIVLAICLFEGFNTQIIEVTPQTSSTMFITVTLPTDLPTGYEKSFNFTETFMAPYIFLRPNFKLYKEKASTCFLKERKQYMQYSKDVARNLNRAATGPILSQSKHNKLIQKYLTEIVNMINLFGSKLEAIVSQKHISHASTYVKKFKAELKTKEKEFHKLMTSLLENNYNYIREMEPKIRGVCATAQKQGEKINEIFKTCIEAIAKQ